MSFPPFSLSLSLSPSFFQPYCLAACCLHIKHKCVIWYEFYRQFFVSSFILPTFSRSHMRNHALPGHALPCLAVMSRLRLYVHLFCLLFIPVVCFIRQIFINFVGLFSLVSFEILMGCRLKYFSMKNVYYHANDIYFWSLANLSL